MIQMGHFEEIWHGEPWDEIADHQLDHDPTPEQDKIHNQRIMDALREVKGE